MEGGDDKIRPFGGVIFLVFAVDADRYHPVIEFGQKVFYVVGIGILAEVETGDVIEDGMAEFLADAALETEVHLHASPVAHLEAVARVNTVVLDVVVQFFDAISIEIMLGYDLAGGVYFGDLAGELAGQAVAAAIGYFLEVIVGDKVQVGIAPFA